MNTHEFPFFKRAIRVWLMETSNIFGALFKHKAEVPSSELRQKQLRMISSKSDLS